MEVPNFGHCLELAIKKERKKARKQNRERKKQSTKKKKERKKIRKQKEKEPKKERNSEANRKDISFRLPSRHVFFPATFYKAVPLIKGGKKHTEKKQNHFLCVLERKCLVFSYHHHHHPLTYEHRRRCRHRHRRKAICAWHDSSCDGDGWHRLSCNSC